MLLRFGHAGLNTEGGVCEMPKITFQHSGKSIDADEGEWMYEVAERAEADIPFACKAGACGTFP